jgi:glycosyltransferase involved in cell wall biosynthesis
MQENYMRVSVVMAIYNCERYVREQLESLVHQFYPIYELIIQDDNSTDNTIGILEEYARNYSFIHLFRNEHRKGMNENFFSAMERATGDYIAITDSDDIWELDKLENQVKSIGEYWLCGGFSKPFSDIIHPAFDDRKPNICIERIIHIASALPGHTMLLKREFLPAVLKLRHYPFIYDHKFSIVAGAYNKITFVNKVLVNYRLHAESESYTVPVMNSPGKHNKSFSNIVKSVIRTFGLYFEIRGQIREWFAMIYEILLSLPEPGKVTTEAQKIAYYQSRRGLINYIKLTWLYIRLRTKIFQVEEKDGLLTILRAIYFPISCSDYFRYMSKHHKKNKL